MTATARSTVHTTTREACAEGPAAAPRRGGSARWLDAEEQAAWRAYLRGAALVLDALDSELQALGISLSEYEILALLSEAPQRCLRMSALAEAVVSSRSRLTHAAGRLEGRGLVRRRQAVQDRRGVEICLTDAGYGALTGLAPIHVAGVRRVLLDALGREEFLRLGASMAAVAAHQETGSRAAGSQG